MFSQCFELPFLLVSFLKAVYILCLHSCWLPSFSLICTSSLYVMPTNPLSCFDIEIIIILLLFTLFMVFLFYRFYNRVRLCSLMMSSWLVLSSPHEIYFLDGVWYRYSCIIFSISLTFSLSHVHVSGLFVHLCWSVIK